MTQLCGKDEARGTVLRIERSSIHDGEGLRTVVFLKGCPLSCAWCSTPESQAAEIQRAADKTYGAVMSLDQVMAEIEKDLIFFFHSGGGMTLSGGEPLFQPDFSAALLKECKALGINTAMESSLHAPFESLERVLPSLDTLYADLKFMDGQKHRTYCGQDNALILDNLRQASKYLRGTGEQGHPEEASSWGRPGRLILRIPLIPGVNDSEEDLATAADFCRELGAAVSAVELLPYHRLGVPTYEKLGRPYPLSGLQPPGEDSLGKKKEYFANCAEEIQIF